MQNDGFDVIVVGGGAAGLSAGLMLARARRSVLVLDAGAPRNAPAAAVHGLFARDGVPPAELTAVGREEVRRYGGEVRTASVTDARRDGDDIVVTAGGDELRARRLLIATGLVDDLPDIPGVRENWGHDVVHCPYCHGWEVRDTAIGVLALGPRAVHQAQLFRQWSDDVVLFTNGFPAPGADESEQLAARDIRVVEGAVTAVESADGRVTGVRLAYGSVVPRATIAIGPASLVRLPFAAGLGLTTAKHPSGMGEHLPVDPTGRTAVPGVWAAGNVTDPFAQVGAAAASAAFAAAQLNMELVQEDVERAVAERRAG
ncbi:NAD(P)/FAD-dependent oxidoreductase [Leifsonia naganoensis]|uniref:Thioredoxin reductase n=1 Tax=Leifsonia naganoensis TaxID=150025 RepID=A0A853DJP2_9MICO|nr:NAD(P)/FAD-dependent oxidoreductase [Leifsonia naganoensis]NYK08477.1 thioredoxin reductase [Leifsonia naganoensis]